MEKLAAMAGGSMIPSNSLMSFHVVLNKQGKPQVRDLLLEDEMTRGGEIPYLDGKFDNNKFVFFFVNLSNEAFIKQN